jgi:cytochrome bd ubiquinol oxidase subunit II
VDLATLCVIWFVIEGVLLTGYAVLDGFDLGVGILHPFVSSDDGDRRVALNAVGPLWDGNEVWLVTFGGALFAAFPDAYATIFSGFYTAFMLLLFALISRAVSIEFRSKTESPAWRQFWDWSFFAGSALATLLFGVATGNAVRGMPLDAAGNFTGTLFDQLGVYPLLVGLMTVALFAMHGGLFLHLKTEGEFQVRLRTWIWRAWGLLLVTYLLVTVWTAIEASRLTATVESRPWAILAAIVNLLAMANVAYSMRRNRPGHAFASSCTVIAALTALLGLTLYPNLVTASNNPALSVTIFNAASSPKTLSIMLIIALAGMPLVLAYTALVYWTFHGKVQLDEHSY